jgi:hypothetical protein
MMPHNGRVRAGPTDLIGDLDSLLLLPDLL